MMLTHCITNLRPLPQRINGLNHTRIVEAACCANLSGLVLYLVYGSLVASGDRVDIRDKDAADLKYCVFLFAIILVLIVSAEKVSR